MNKNEMIEYLGRKIYLEILENPEKEIDSSEALISSGVIDSFSLVDVALMVEDKFDVQIDDSELNADSFDTLDQLAELIISRL